ncbi:LPXTG cell wall anchor domain-containing protein, partial [Streptococcus hohhotensis]|uniref:LPXTG cell wall anchor domain-containing protein n=1 Tax=Streptococcus hohhotensis TaxID=2866998 RepID=UPI0039C5C402
PTEKKEIFKQNGAKSTVVVTPLEPSVRYDKDATRARGGENVTVAGTPGTSTVTTTYTVNPTDGSLIPHEELAVVVPSKPTVVRVPAKDEVEYLKEGDDVVKKTTSYAVNASTGTLTPTETTEIFTQNGAKSKVVVTSLEPSVRYEKDATRVKGGAQVTVAGTPGTRTVTTTYTVNPTDGLLIPHEEPAVEVPSTPTVVQVPAKDEIEYLKEGDNVVKKTTTYAVNVSTGHLTPTEKKEVFKKDGAKSTVIVTSIEPSVRYEKDATKVKGGETITVAGTPGTRTVTTTYTVNPTDGLLIPHEEPAVEVPSTPTVVQVPAKDEIEYLKEGDNVVKKTTTYAVNVSTGHLTPTEKKEVFKKDGAKSTVVVTSIEPSVRYEKDATRAKGGAQVTVAGTPGTRTVTTTYTVNPTDGSLIPHEGKPVIKSSTPTVIKVPAKDEVEYLKEGDDVVKKTTSYQVNASTGGLTPTETTEIFKRNVAKSTVVVTPLEPSIRYEKDATRAKGGKNVTTAGTSGTRTVTTTYTVNLTDGSLIPHEGKPVIKSSTTTVVKVPAKDKVVETPIEPEVEYIKDVEKDFGTPAQHTEGEKGKIITTTTYDVDPKDGHITEHVGNPVVIPAGKTIVKVGAKTKVEQSKDPEGRDVIDTTTYEVDPQTGKVTPTTTTTYGPISKKGEPEVQTEIPEYTNPISSNGVDGNGNFIDPPTVELPKFKGGVNGELPGSITLPELTIEVHWIDEDGNILKSSVKTGNEKDAEHGSIPGYEFVRTVIAENEPVLTHIFSKVSGSTHSNPATPPKVTIFENGVLPDSIELPEQMIEIHWIDENGNGLKLSVKTGNEKNAEHGSIPGYEFVRTVIDENEPVITHIFRKVSGSTNPNTIPVAPVTPDTNGGSGQDTPAPATPTPNAVTPNTDQVDTKTTVDNGAKSNNSQTVLPNTGTESNVTLASLGLLGMLGGLGLAFGKKKKTKVKM